MPKSAHLRSQDVRSLIRIVGECRDLGDDPVVWRQHWFRQLGRLVGAELANGGEVKCLAGPLRMLGYTGWGWESESRWGEWHRAMAERVGDGTSTRLMLSCFDRMGRTGDRICQSRRDLQPDREWYRSWFYQVNSSLIGADHILLCFHQLPELRGEFSGIILHRDKGRRADFHGRDRRLVVEAHAALVPLIGGPLARFADPSPTALAPRARQILGCLLEGDSDKQVAQRLGISRYTVNEYVKAIFQHFRVRSRPELLALWVRRGRRGRFGWADNQATDPPAGK